MLSFFPARCPLLIICAWENNQAAEDLKEFLELFSCLAVSAQNFRGAEYEYSKKRLQENRKPATLPEEKNYHKLLAYLEENIRKDSKFVYLTLLNGRRGSEVAEMTVDDLVQRKSWYPQESDKYELLNQYLVFFVMGKNDELLPICIPLFCVKGLDTLADSQVRAKANISIEYSSVFPFTHHQRML